MATRTAIQNGLWSDTTTWGGAAIPVNGDAVVINTGVTVTYDVDQSGFANGLLSLQIDGKLTFKPDTNTCLKMNGNITGTGELWVGTEENPIQRPTAGSEYRCYLLFNSTGTINIPTIRMYGWYPEKEYTQLSADASVGQNQIVLQEDLGLQQGDIICIGSGAEYGVTVEAAKGIYSVSSYDSGAKTVTLTTNLQTNRLKDDYVAWWSRPIKVNRVSGTATLISSTTNLNNGILCGVFTPTTCSFIQDTTPKTNYVNGWIFKHISTSRNFYTPTNGGLFEDSISSGSYGLAPLSTNILFKRCIGLHGMLSYSNTASRFEDCISQNTTYVPGSGVVIRGVFSNLQYIALSNNSASTLIIDSSFKNIPLPVTYPTVYEMKLINCNFENAYLTNVVGSLINCSISDNLVDNSIPQKCDNFRRLESFDHNQIPGNYRAWCKGGTIETDFDGVTVLPGRLILNCESDDYPVFRDFQVQLPQSRTMRWQALTRKSFTGGSVQIELIDPTADPLIDSSAQPLVSYSLPDTADTNLPLKLGYKSTVPMQAILRISAQNASGTVEVDTRLIENRVQHGQ